MSVTIASTVQTSLENSAGSYQKWIAPSIATKNGVMKNRASSQVVTSPRKRPKFVQFAEDPTTLVANPKELSAYIASPSISPVPQTAQYPPMETTGKYQTTVESASEADDQLLNELNQSTSPLDLPDKYRPGSAISLSNFHDNNSLFSKGSTDADIQSSDNEDMDLAEQPVPKSSSDLSLHTASIPSQFSAPRTTKDLESLFSPQPPHPRPDTEFSHRYKSLKAATCRWAARYFSNIPSTPENSLDLLRLARESPELMEYVNFIASPPVDGSSWEDVFVKRRAMLVYGILGKMLEVHVFGHEMFGASKSQLTALRSLDLEMFNSDGFPRQSLRATTISSFLSSPRTLPPLLLPSLQTLHASTLTLLSPLLPPYLCPPPLAYTHSLSHLLLLAAKLSLDLRREPATIYYFTPALRSTPLDTTTTHVLNEPLLLRTSQHSSPMLKIQISCFPNLTAYRRGNGRPRGENKGFRTRRIAKADAVVEYATGSASPSSGQMSLRAYVTRKAGNENGAVAATNGAGLVGGVAVAAGLTATAVAVGAGVGIGGL